MEQNLFDFLLEQFYTTPQPEGAAGVQSIEPNVGWFIDFAKKYLKKNPAIGTATVAYGLALRLQQGQVLLLAENELKPENPIRAVFVTGTGIDPRGTGTVPTHTVPVTNPDK